MKVRLTRKHADRIDGIDLSRHDVGDMLDLPLEQARLIIAEDWAHPDRRVLSSASDHQRRSDDGVVGQRPTFSAEKDRAVAADRAVRARKST